MLLASEDALAMVVQLVFGLVFATICAAIASGRGRSGVAWFFIGMFTGCIGLIVLLAIPDLKKEEERHRRHEQENRRLREQLKKERQIADQRHAQLDRRIGTHDQALGLDTSGTPAALTDRDADVTEPPPPGASEPQWYFAQHDKKIGPISAKALRELISAGAVTPDTLVWSTGMANWQPLAKVTAFDEDRRG